MVPPPPTTDQRLADLAAFADGLVHDLRNPLNVIRTNLYLLRQRFSADDRRAVRAVERIDEQISLALRILEGVQAFYRGDSPNLQRVDLSETVRNSLSALHFSEDVVLRAELQPDLPFAEADPQLIAAALYALINNAFEAIEGAGAITVTTCAAGNSLRLVVEDSGPGVAIEALARAFEPFFTTKEKRAGLGLALAEKVGRVHHGRAYLENRPDGGARAVIELPAAAPAIAV